MAKNRVKFFLKVIGKSYFLVVTLWVLYAFWASYMMYIEDGVIYDYCINVTRDEFYLFSANSETGCLLDWWPFLQEAIIWPLLIYCALISPVLIGILADIFTSTKKPWRTIN